MKPVKKDITVIGNGVVDVLAGPVDRQVFQSGSYPVENIKLSFGGDALNESVLLSRFGKRVELISRLGQDEAGQRVLGYLRENQVSVDSVTVEEGIDTSVNIVLFDKKGERYFLTNPRGSQRQLEEKDILPYLDAAGDIVSFASMFISASLDIPAMTRVFQRIKSRPGRILSVDVTKAKHGEKLEDLRDLLPYVDYFLPNEEEAALLTGKDDPYLNGKLFVEAGVKCAVIKRGRRGCLICTEREQMEVPAFPVEKCVDTTGAGDSFAAGFLWALSEGYSLADCGKFGCAAASCSVECVGATDGILSVEEPMRRFRGFLDGTVFH